MYEKENYLYCKKCNKYIENCIDLDYHENTIHADLSNIYVKKWYETGKKGMSPYD